MAAPPQASGSVPPFAYSSFNASFPQRSSSAENHASLLGPPVGESQQQAPGSPEITVTGERRVSAPNDPKSAMPGFSPGPAIQQGWNTTSSTQPPTDNEHRRVHEAIPLTPGGDAPRLGPRASPPPYTVATAMCPANASSSSPPGTVSPRSQATLASTDKGVSNIPSVGIQPKDVTFRPPTSRATDDAARFDEFACWVQHGLRGGYTNQLMVVGFVIFLEFWLRFLRINVSVARAFFQKYHSMFLPHRRIEIDDMRVMTSTAHVKVSRHIERWRRKRVHLQISRLAYRSLFHFLAEPSYAALLHTVIARITFRVVHDDVVGEGAFCLDEEDVEDSSVDRRETGRVLLHSSADDHSKSPSLSASALLTDPCLVDEDSSIPSTEPPAGVPWGLLSGPFNKVERVESKDKIPWYFNFPRGRKTAVAMINGEITKPVDPNLALPLCNESPWAIQAWHQWNTQRSREWIRPATPDQFPSILSYNLDCVTSELTAVKLSHWSSASWLLAARENGVVGVWDVPSLLKGSSVQPHDSSVSAKQEEEEEEFGCSAALSGPRQHPNATSESDRVVPQLLIGHERSVTSLCFVPFATPCLTEPTVREKHCLSAAADGTVRLWSLEKAVALASYEAHQAPLWSVDVSVFGNFFLCGGSDTLASLWSFTRRHPLRLFAGHLRDVQVVKSSPNSTLMASGSTDASVKLWDIRSAKALHTLKSHTSPIDSLAFSPNGRLLACTGGTREFASVVVWDLGLQKPLMSIELPQTVGRLISLTFSHGSHTLAMGCSNGALVLANIDDPTWGTAYAQKLSQNFSGSQSSFGEFSPPTALRIVPLGDRFPADVVFTPENVLAVCSVPMSNAPWRPPMP